MCRFGETRTLTEVMRGSDGTGYGLGATNSAALPNMLRGFLRQDDVPKPLSPVGSGVLIERSSPRPQTLLFTPIGYVTQPKQNQDITGFVARVEIPKNSQD